MLIQLVVLIGLLLVDGEFNGYLQLAVYVQGREKKQNQREERGDRYGGRIEGNVWERRTCLWGV